MMNWIFFILKNIYVSIKIYLKLFEEKLKTNEIIKASQIRLKSEIDIGVSEKVYYCHLFFSWN